MQKVTGTETTVEIFENDIDLFLHQFQEENDIENIKSESQSVWNACLMYIQKHVFKDRAMLKQNNNIYTNSSNIPTNCNAYNYELIDSICDYYIYICTLYDKEISILGFSKLLGIDDNVILEWGNNYTNSNKLSTTASNIYKKLVKNREESLSNKLATGNKNPVGILAILNRHYQWNLPGVSKESAKTGALSAAELPKLGGKMSVPGGLLADNSVIDADAKEG